MEDSLMLSENQELKLRIEENVILALQELTLQQSLLNHKYASGKVRILWPVISFAPHRLLRSPKEGTSSIQPQHHHQHVIFPHIL